MNKIIYTDIDLTLLDFNRPLEQFMIANGHDVTEGQLEGECHLWKVIGCTPQTADAIIHEFFESEHFAQLPPFNDAVEPIQRLYNEGWRFVGISACPHSVDPQIRHSNLESAFGVPFEKVYHSGFGGCKRDILERFEPTVWVEDHVRNAHIGYKLGYKTFLIDQKHNRNAEVYVTRVSGWKEISDALCMVN